LLALGCTRVGGCPAGPSKHGYGTLARPRDEADNGTRLVGVGWMSHTR